MQSVRSSSRKDDVQGVRSSVDRIREQVPARAQLIVQGGGGGWCS